MKWHLEKLIGMFDNNVYERLILEISFKIPTKVLSVPNFPILYRNSKIHNSIAVKFINYNLSVGKNNKTQNTEKTARRISVS